MNGEYEGGSSMETNLFNAMFQQSAIAMAIVRINGKFIYVNDALCELTGYKKEELINETNAIFTQPEDLTIQQVNTKKLIKGEIPFYQMEKRYIHKQGHIVWGLLSVNLILDDYDVPTYVICQVQNITEKKEMERRLLDSEKKYRLIAENSSDRIVTLDLQGKYKYFSPSVQLQLGYESEELYGIGPVNLIHENDQAFFNNSLKAVVESDLSVTVTYRIRHKNGDYLWTETNVKCIYGNRQIKGILLICRDISERKLIEMKLKQSNKTINNILESITDGFVAIDEGDCYIYANRAAEKILNKSRESLIGYKWFQEIPEETSNQLLKNYFTVKKNKANLKFEMYVHYLNSWFTVRMYYKNDVISIYFVNITKKKQLEKRLLESEERFRRLVEFSPETIAVLVDEKLEYLNPAGMKLLGAKSTKEIIGRSIWEFYPEDDRETVNDNLTKILNGSLKSMIAREHTIYRIDGIPVTISSTVSATTYNGKQAIQAIVRDITELKKMDEWLQKSEKLSLVGQLAAGVAHEVRNPLTSIKGFIQLAKTTKEFKEFYIDIILSELDRTETIIYEFLSLAKPNETRELITTNFNTILLKVIKLLETQALMQDINIQYSFTKELFVDCDENQIKQAFINLIQNAIEASYRNGNIFITLDEVNEETVIVKIEDQGCGISKERLKKLGEPFYSTKEKGTGIGLLVTYKIIESHNGKLSFISEEGNGTTAEIILPKKSGKKGYS